MGLGRWLWDLGNDCGQEYWHRRQPELEKELADTHLCWLELKLEIDRTNVRKLKERYEREQAEQTAVATPSEQDTSHVHPSGDECRDVRDDHVSGEEALSLQLREEERGACLVRHSQVRTNDVAHPEQNNAFPSEMEDLNTALNKVTEKPADPRSSLKREVQKEEAELSICLGISKTIADTWQHKTRRQVLLWSQKDILRLMSLSMTRHTSSRAAVRRPVKHLVSHWQ